MSAEVPVKIKIYKRDEKPTFEAMLFIVLNRPLRKQKLLQLPKQLFWLKKG